MSLASRPGNFGTRLHNFLYSNLHLNYFYKSFKTKNLEHAVAGIRALAIRGCDTSIPYIIDSVANPMQTQLIQTATRPGKSTVRGIEITMIQSIEQFKLYTGVTPDENTVPSGMHFVQSFDSSIAVIGLVWRPGITILERFAVMVCNHQQCSIRPDHNILIGRLINSSGQDSSSFSNTSREAFIPFIAAGNPANTAICKITSIISSFLQPTLSAPFI